MMVLSSPQQGQANAPAAGQRGGGGRGRGGPNPLLSQPAPRLPDGTINLGRAPGELGIWQLPYIQNMGDRSRVVGAPPAPARGEGAARGGRGGNGQIGGGGGAGGGGQRGGYPY